MSRAPEPAWVKEKHKFVDIVGSDGEVTHVKYSLRHFCGFMQTISPEDVNSSVFAVKAHLPEPGTVYARMRVASDPVGTPDLIADVWPESPSQFLSIIFNIIAAFDPTIAPNHPEPCSFTAPLTAPFRAVVDETPFASLACLAPARLGDVARLACALQVPLVVEAASAALASFVSRMTTHRGTALSVITACIPPRIPLTAFLPAPPSDTPGDHVAPQPRLGDDVDILVGTTTVSPAITVEVVGFDTL